ncbi:MAG: hypothetical protein WCI73_07510, partial [Phycisphaerae bacterium]
MNLANPHDQTSPSATVLPPKVNVAAIPQSLKDRPQWVAWRFEIRNGKETKIPIDPHRGGKACSNDASTWGTFEETLQLLAQRPDLQGIGYMFSGEDGVAGVDLDDCLDTQGQIKPWAQELLALLDSYTEISPSGSGLKIFLQGRKPGPRCRKPYGNGEVEIYDKVRFFTTTGRQWPGTPGTVEPRQTQLER